MRKNTMKWIARIKLMEARDAEGNKYLINKLKRKLRKEGIVL